MVVRLLASLLLLAACSTPQVPGQKSISPSLPFDPDILAYDHSMEGQQYAPPPYVTVFHKNGKKVFFVTAEYISELKYTELKDHPTFRTIAKIFLEHRPTANIVEGVNLTEGPERARILAKARMCDRKSDPKICNEALYTISLSRQAHTLFESGEPSEDEVKLHLQRMGYSKMDLLGYYTLKQVPHFVRQKRLAKANTERVITALLQKYALRIEYGKAPNYPQFLDWYKKNFDQAPSLLELNYRDVSPDTSEQASRIQQIAAQVHFIRDQALMRMIRRLSVEHDTVLVVYGGSHLTTIRPSLIKLFGQPSNHKFF